MRPQVGGDLAQQSMNRPATQQALGGFLQGGEVRHTLEAQQFTKLRPIAQDGDDATVVGAMKGLQGQTGNQLWLGEGLGREAMCVGWQTPFGDPQGNQRHLPW